VLATKCSNTKLVTETQCDSESGKKWYDYYYYYYYYYVGLRYLLIILHSRVGNLGIWLSTVGINMQYLVSRDRLRKRWLDTPVVYALVSHIHTEPRTKLSVCFSVLIYILSLSPALSVGGEAAGAGN
jgi:hypothetical protein